MAKWIRPDPYDTYLDGNCRNVSGQIVNCADPTAVSPAKFPPDDEDGDDDDAASDDGE